PELPSQPIDRRQATAPCNVPPPARAGGSKCAQVSVRQFVERRRAARSSARRSVVPESGEDRWSSTCGLCGEPVDLYEEHYRLVSWCRTSPVIEHSVDDDAGAR